MTKKKYGSEISETPEELREDMKRSFINEAKIQPNIHVKATYSKDKITKISVIYSNNVKVFTVHCEPIISQISDIPTVTNDAKIICKIVHKDGIKFLNAMETSTEFFNSKNLSTNRYTTIAFAKPAYLAAYPLITVREA